MPTRADLIRGGVVVLATAVVALVAIWYERRTADKAAILDQNAMVVRKSS